MIDITCDDFTPMERRIYNAIIFEGCDISELAEKFYITPATIKTHLNSICRKKQIWGSNRLFKLAAGFVKEVLNAEKSAKNAYIKGYNDGFNFIKSKVIDAIEGEQ